MKICFATNNTNKIREIKNLLKSGFELLSLKDIGCEVDLPENQLTLEGNSLEKAKYVYEHFQVDCFADDTGLEVEALHGEPGVFSARYGGPERDSSKNISVLLKNLEGQENRSARFRTVITLIISGEIVQFEGVVKGKISTTLRGEGGFGYDPVFIPEGFDRSFAEMRIEEKNKISHRGIAVEKLVTFLNGLKKTSSYEEQ